jgi:2-(1,2-epoxy-1,2-dihydrophenyl)acetyl-CoA isomerase
MSEASALIVHTEGPIQHIRLNRPERLNAIDTEQDERILQAVLAAGEDPSVRVIAFSGEGRAFCSGHDMRPMKEGSAPKHVWPERYHSRLVDLSIGLGPLLLQEVSTAIRNIPKPTVALIHGYALGAGYGLALCCDFRLATTDCRLGDPRVHRAMRLSEGWLYILPRLVPAGHAARIALLGEPISGVEAERIGLVHRTYPPDRDLRESAHEFLLGLAGLHPQTYAFIKRQILDGLDLSYDEALAHHPRL